MGIESQINDIYAEVNLYGVDIPGELDVESLGELVVVLYKQVAQLQRDVADIKAIVLRLERG